MKRSDLNLLHALDALSRTGSVKAAAEMLHLSAPAMSHTLARLREATGDPLFVRAGRRLVPTPRALSMATATQALVEQANALLAPPSDDEAWPSLAREFVVAAPDELVIAHGVRLLDEVRSRMPQASLSFLPLDGASFDRLRRGASDLEIQPMGELPPEAMVDVLQEQRAVVAMRRDHPLARRKLTLSRYAAASHIALSTRTVLEQTIEESLARAGVVRKVTLKVPSPYAALTAAARSDQLATVQSSIASAVAQGLRLVCVPTPMPVPALRVVQAWHPRMGNDVPHAWLRTCVRNVFGGSAADRRGGPSPS